MNTKIPIKPIEEMDGEFIDFIGVWENLVPKDFCVKAITEFNRLYADSLILLPREEVNEWNNLAKTKSLHVQIPQKGNTQFESTNMGRKDESLFIQSSKHIAAPINSFLYSCFNQYETEYGQLKNVPLISYDIKAQQTKPGGGYHHWHYENSSHECAARELAWMIYLNDMPEGEAETEFLYQKRRIRPTEGTVVIWPAGMTHVHRGNPVYSKTKYILTGWFLKEIQ